MWCIYCIFQSYVFREILCFQKWTLKHNQAIYSFRVEKYIIQYGKTIIIITQDTILIRSELISSLQLSTSTTVKLIHTSVTLGLFEFNYSYLLLCLGILAAVRLLLDIVHQLKGKRSGTWVPLHWSDTLMGGAGQRNAALCCLGG